MPSSAPLADHSLSRCGTALFRAHPSAPCARAPAQPPTRAQADPSLPPLGGRLQTPPQIVGDALSAKAHSVAEQAKFGWNDAARFPAAAQLNSNPSAPFGASFPRDSLDATISPALQLVHLTPRPLAPHFTPQDSAATFLLNIPARFDFESALYEARLSGKSLTPADLSAMMTKAWADRYGDALEEMDPMFWASKLHFHLTGTEFYNFPYSFGYLFALGVCARREELGALLTAGGGTHV